MHRETKKRKDCVTPSTAILPLLWWSGMEPTVPPWCACTDNSWAGECSFKYISHVGFLVSPPMLNLPSYKQQLPSKAHPCEVCSTERQKTMVPPGND